METHLVISILLLCIIIGFEGWRRVSNQPLGLLSVANLIFALNYCVSPLLLAFVPGSGFETGPFGQPLFMLPIVDDMTLKSASYTQAILVAFFAYAALVIVYMGVERRLTFRSLQQQDIPIRWLMMCGVGLGVVAISALLLYSGNFKQINLLGEHQYSTRNLFDDGFGLIKMMKLGMLVRADKLAVQWGFLQIIVMLGVPALIMLSAVGLRLKGIWRAVFLSLATVVWTAVVMRTYHAAGRMELGVVVALIPLAMLLSLRSKKVMALGVLGLFLFGMFIGLARHDFFPDPRQTLDIMTLALVDQFGRSLLFMANEFAFPFPVVAHTLEIVPGDVAYRYFVDIPLAMLYMLPSIGGADTWPEMISDIHARSVSGMLPYDLISFGIYSAGIVGVGIVFSVMGALLAVFDTWLMPGGGWLVQCFRAAWMMYLPFRIMYADPYTSMKTGFGLIVGTFLILGMTWLAKRRTMTQ